MATSGVCIGCGCTDTRACPGGCHWVDADCTKCSSCYPELLTEQDFDQVIAVHELDPPRPRSGKYSIRNLRNARGSARDKVKASTNSTARRNGRKRGRS